MANLRADGLFGLFLLSAAIAFFQTGTAAAELISAESRTLRLYDVFKPDFRASLVLISEDGNQAYFVENEPKAQTSALRIVSIPEFSTEKTIELGHSAVEIKADPANPDRVYVTGALAGQQVVTAVSMSQSLQSSYIADAGTGVLTVLPDRSGGAFLASGAARTIIRLKPSDFRPLDEALDESKLRSAKPETWQIAGVTGISEMALSPDGLIVFVSDSGRPQIVAVSAEKSGAVIAQFGGQSGEAGEQILLAFHESTRKTQRSKSGEAASLLIADSNQNRLILADYNENFSTFDLIAEAGLGLDPQVQQKQQQQQQQQQRQPTPDLLHLSVSSDQSSILLGNSGQLRLDLLSRSGATLQRLLSFELPSQPTKVTISGDGKTALALMRSGGVAFLSSETFEASDPIGGVPETIGDETIRKIQYRLERMGFQVGEIDGIAGSRTKIAASDAVGKFGLDPSLSVDKPEDLLRALEQLKSAN